MAAQTRGKEPQCIKGSQLFLDRKGACLGCGPVIVIILQGTTVLNRPAPVIEGCLREYTKIFTITHNIGISSREAVGLAPCPHWVSLFEWPHLVVICWLRVQKNHTLCQLVDWEGLLTCRLMMPKQA